MERRLDELGRVVIPMEFRKALGWGKGVAIDMQMKSGTITLSKSETCCSLCGSSQELKEVKGVRICQGCIEEIKVGTFWDVE